MRKVMLLAVLFVSLWCNSVLAAYVMPIANGGVQGVQNAIIAVMAKEYPGAQLTEQSQNILGFREEQQTILGNATAFYTFSVFPRVQGYGDSVYTEVKLTVRFLGEEIEKDYFDKILIDVKAVCDGFYYYGCDFDKNRIINIRHDSQAYMAGLRDGDKIVAINGYKIVNNTMLGRVMACKVVTFETKDGKVVTLEGVYFSPEEVRARYLGY